jgi:CubicO group peptidase (beta-lactamase class C family)
LISLREIINEGEEFELKRFSIVCLLILVLPMLLQGVVNTEAASPPYPNSPIISGITWAPANTIIRAAEGGDNWPITWGDDGDLYTGYGDGNGFEPRLSERLSLGFAKVSGSPDNFAGTNIRSDAEQKGDRESGKKSSGMLMVAGTLFMWVRNANNQGEQCQLAWSTDRAVSWTWSDWKFAEFGYCTFINFGQNYSGARDNYIYTVTHNHPNAYLAADHFILMRVPTDQVTNRDAYEFFQSVEPGGSAVWTADINKRGAVFTNPGRARRSSISYSAALGRYLWWQGFPSTIDERQSGGFGIFDAPEPWGPWTTVYYTEKWDVGPGETAAFPTKWMSADGKSLHLVFSGNDAFSVRQATLQLGIPGDRTENFFVSLPVVVKGEFQETPPNPSPTPTPPPPSGNGDWPLPEWAAASPSEMGMEEARLAEARDFALTGGGAGMVTRSGRLVMSWGNTGQQIDVKSVTKSFGSAVLGLAIKDSLVGLEDKAQSCIADLGLPPESNKTTGWLDDITLLHLATHTAGFGKNGGFTDLMFQPGTKWSYSDGGPNWLADCLTLTYRKDLNSLMFERIFTPLGISTGELTWRSNLYRSDTIEGVKRREFGAGIHASADALARFGYLFLRRGNWNGEQLLPENFVAEATTAVPEVVGLPVELPGTYANASDHYGLLWWTNTDGTLVNVPRDAYWAWGLGDNLIVVIPSLDIVASRTGSSWSSPSSLYEVLRPFIEPIAQSVSD